MAAFAGESAQDKRYVVFQIHGGIQQDAPAAADSYPEIPLCTGTSYAEFSQSAFHAFCGQTVTSGTDQRVALENQSSSEHLHDVSQLRIDAFVSVGGTDQPYEEGVGGTCRRCHNANEQ
jgi:hypothetical protein